MKVFISADIEGTAGIAHWDEAERTHSDYQEFRSLMTEEVVAACEGAHSAGATEILVKDAHDSGRNLVLDRLPDYVKVIRGWSGHPDAMMFGIEKGVAAAIYTGYHAKAGSEANPLAHTTSLRISRMMLNGELASEFTINALCAAEYGVPSVFLSGDAEICSDALSLVPDMVTVDTSQGFGRASVSIAPARARALIRDGVAAALSTERRSDPPSCDGPFQLVIEFSNPTDAWRGSWYPGVSLHGPRAIAFEAENFFDVRRALRFLTA